MNSWNSKANKNMRQTCCVLFLHNIVVVGNDISAKRMTFEQRKNIRNNLPTRKMTIDHVMTRYGITWIISELITKNLG